MTPPFLGILMLDTQFPRPLGDAGNPASWAMPVHRVTVRGASPHRVVRLGDVGLLDAFVQAGLALVADGAGALTTSCGFLVTFQAELQAALPVPVWTSSLLALPHLVNAGRTPGVITVDAGALGPSHWHAAQASSDTPVVGLEPGGHLQTTLLENRSWLDSAAAERDAVAAGLRLINEHPDVDTIVLECTNLPPYADAIRHATGRPVEHLVSWVQRQWSRRSTDPLSNKALPMAPMPTSGNP